MRRGGEEGRGSRSRKGEEVGMREGGNEARGKKERGQGAMEEVAK